MQLISCSDNTTTTGSCRLPNESATVQKSPHTSLSTESTQACMINLRHENLKRCSRLWPAARRCLKLPNFGTLAPHKLMLRRSQNRSAQCIDLHSRTWVSHGILPCKPMELPAAMYTSCFATATLWQLNMPRPNPLVSQPAHVSCLLCTCPEATGPHYAQPLCSIVYSARSWCWKSLASMPFLVRLPQETLAPQEHQEGASRSSRRHPLSR